MSEYEGQPLKDMNPFSNNRPKLTASERIRNKRDAAIYEAEKKQFQESKKKCGNRNVKYYRNGKIKSMKSYKLQKSLARGNILCNDCDNNGTFCKAPVNKDCLNPIKMGNNSYSEFWGGSSAINLSGAFGWTQIPGFSIISSDISGVWGGSLTDVSKSLIGPGGILPGSAPAIPIPFGYVKNLLTNPRNLDGSGIIIDPSNILFPDELCDPFRYLKNSYLKTYLVITSAISIWEAKVGPNHIWRGLNCFDSSLNSLIGKTVVINNPGTGDDRADALGTLSSICCIGNIDELTPFLINNPLQKGNFGLFKIYIEVSYLVEAVWGRAITKKNNMPFNPGVVVTPFTSSDVVLYMQVGAVDGIGDISIWPWMQESLNIIQGSIPPSQNQSKYNATEKSYMACLENGTHGINFTKQNIRRPVKHVVCNVDISGNTV